MSGLNTKYAISLTKDKIEFFEQKVDGFWSVADRIVLDELNDQEVGERFAAHGAAWREQTRAVLLWLPENVCHRYDFEEEKTTNEIFAEFMREKRVARADLAVFSSVEGKKKSYHYLAVEMEAFRSAIEYAEDNDFEVKGLARAPKSSNFPTPVIFDIESLELAGNGAVQEVFALEEEAEAESVESAEEVAGDVLMDEEDLEPAAETAEVEPVQVEVAEEGASEDVMAGEAPDEASAVEAAEQNGWPVKASVAAVLSLLVVLFVGGLSWVYLKPADEVQYSQAGDAALADESEEGALDASVEADEEIGSEGIDTEGMPAEIANQPPEAAVEVEVAEDEVEEDTGVLLPAPPARDEEKILAMAKRLDAQNVISSNGGSSGGGVDLSNIMLLGIFGPTGQPQAMIRSPGGKVHTVNTGQSVDGWSVVAISRKEVIVSKAGNQLRLTVPN